MRRTLFSSILASYCVGRAGAQAPTLPPQFPTELRSYDPQELHAFLFTDVYRHSAQQYGGRDWVRVIRHQMQTATSSPITVRKEVTIAGQITEITARDGGNEIYVAAMKANGEALVERWIFTPSNGAYVYGTGQPIPPVGVAQPPYHSAASVHVQGGGSFSATSAATIREPRRTTIYESSLNGLVEDLVVEPEGRFLLMMMHQTHKILRVDLTDPSFPTQTVFEPAQYPMLVPAEDLTLWFHATEGRMYVLREVSPFTSSPEILLIRDSNNDAILESPQALTHDQFIAAGYEEPGLWKELWEPQ